MFKDVFLPYANHSLKDHPQNLYRVFEAFKALRNIHIDELALKSIANVILHFITFVTCGDLQSAENIRKEVTFDDDYGRRDFEIAFEGVYGYRGGYCEDECELNSERKAVFQAGRFTDPKRLKCYECDQLYFIEILSGLAEGEEYRHIAGSGLPTLMANAYNGLDKVVGVHVVPAPPSKEELRERVVDGYSLPTKPFFQEELREMLFLNLKTTVYRDIQEGNAYKGIFGELFLEQIVAYSLTEFLLGSDKKKRPHRIRLKKCEQCGVFYVAKIVTDIQKFCSERCKRMSKWPPEKWNEYMAQYRRQEKEQMKEKEIQRRMKSGDMTREEVLAQMREDGEL